MLNKTCVCLPKHCLFIQRNDPEDFVSEIRIRPDYSGVVVLLLRRAAVLRHGNDEIRNDVIDSSSGLC